MQFVTMLLNEVSAKITYETTDENQTVVQKAQKMISTSKQLSEVKVRFQIWSKIYRQYNENVHGRRTMLLPVLEKITYKVISDQNHFKKNQ